MKLLYNKVFHYVLDGMRNDRLSLLYSIRVHSSRVFFYECKIRRDKLWLVYVWREPFSLPLKRQYEAKKWTVHSSGSIPCLTLYAFSHHILFCKPWCTNANMHGLQKVWVYSVDGYVWSASCCFCAGGPLCRGPWLISKCSSLFFNVERIEDYRWEKKPKFLLYDLCDSG
jgi:hypothetical protein